MRQAYARVKPGNAWQTKESMPIAWWKMVVPGVWERTVGGGVWWW